MLKIVALVTTVGIILAGCDSIHPSSTPATAHSPNQNQTKTNLSTNSSLTGGGLNSNVAPGGNFDLSKWELQLPTGSGHSVTTISSSQLKGVSGYQDPYFYTDKTDGAMTFMDPKTGVTTSGSLHPRSELREVTDGWPTNGTNILSVTEKVTQVANHVCIGQIFQSPPAPSKPMLELMYYNDGSIKAMIENTNQGGSSTSHPIGSVALGTKFSYSLSLTDQTITVIINDKANQFDLPSDFKDEKFYFKAGDYDQSATAGTPDSTPGTVVNIYSISVTHN